jgi:hypothetical protein
MGHIAQQRLLYKHFRKNFVHRAIYVKERFLSGMFRADNPQELLSFSLVPA